MAELQLVSWNVNGLRAVSKKPDWQWFADTHADIVGLQEIKADAVQLAEDVREPAGWHSYFCSSQGRKGYSGVALYSRPSPLQVNMELPDEAFQGEGRLIHAEYPDFHFFTVYFPNGGEELAKGQFKRVPYKMGFFDAFLAHAEKLRQDKPIVVCGDFNIAHKAIDLARPKANVQNTGYLPEERSWMDKFVNAGYLDTFRLLNQDKADAYSWWSYKAKARATNVGWRLDYFFVSEELKNCVQDAWIENHIFGSDHCPVGLCLNI